MAKSGFVYCIANDAMPGLVKIGATTRDPEDRLDEARHATWAPSCFRITAQAAVDDAFGTERVLHALLAPRRFEARREFFRLSHEEARAVFAVVEIIAGTTIPSTAPETRAETSDATLPSVAPEPRDTGAPYDARIVRGLQSPEAKLRAWIESKYIRLSLREKDSGTKLEALHSAYVSVTPPVHQKPLGKTTLAAMLRAIYPGIGPHKNTSSSAFLYLIR
jgi:hypothetical protein